ncbi:MAG: glycosyltransferase family A protein, partial [Pseudomonadota bacterium]
STRAICDRYARAHDNFHSIWLTNGGVSRARNSGLRWLMDQHPDLEAVFVLDGDDLILPNAIASNLAVLRASQEAQPQKSFGWVYFDQQEFGSASKALRYPPNFSAYRWYGSNLSQPSCLYSADMFRAGVFWDEDMRNGIEDWEYWYQAAAAGFRGAYDPRTTLLYRRLTGNRSSLNRAKDALTKRYMRKKHAAHLTPPPFLAAEQEEFPRWANFEPILGGWTLRTDPRLPATRHASPATLEAAMMTRAQQYARSSYFFEPYFPGLALSLAPNAKALLDNLRLHHAVLFEMEQALQSVPFCTLELRQGSGTSLRLSKERRDMTPGQLVSSAATGVSVSQYLELGRLGFDWAQTRSAPPDSAVLEPERPQAIPLRRPRKPIQMVALVLDVPEGIDLSKAVADHGAALQALSDPILKTFAALGDTDVIIENNKYCGADKAAHAPLARELFGIWPMLPLVPQADVLEVAFVLGEGTGETWHALAERFIEAVPQGGLRLHLAGLGTTVPDVPEHLAPHVASRMVLDFPDGGPATDQIAHYFGVPLYERALQAPQDA